MPQEYTRQRQGRDFFVTPRKAQSQHSDAPHADEDAKKSLDGLLEQSKKDIERNAVPIDGGEPQGISAAEKGRG